MPLQSKRRRLSLLTLPVVVAAGFLIVAKLASWQRSDLIANLAGSISRGDTRAALDAVQKLATISNPPISVLVTAAASDEHETAGAAQVAIDRLLRSWQRDVERQKRYGTIAGQLNELAKSLAETRADFSIADRAWLEAAVRKILRISNKFPPAQTPLVAVHCDALLTSIGTGRFPKRREELPGFEGFNDAIAGKPDGIAPPPQFAPLVSSGQDAIVGERKTQSSENSPAPYTPPAIAEPLSRSRDDTDGSSQDGAPMNDLRSHNGGLAEDGASNSLSSRPGSAPRLGGSPPIFRILPAMPINALPKDAEEPNRLRSDARTATDGRSDASSNPIAEIDSCALLKTWLASENGDIQSIERELTRRGFGKLSKPLVRQFFSDSPQDRMRMVDNALAQPGGGSEAWLLLLASDSDPDVRLFAVTFMATSNNAALVEKAWQAAIHDHDPRVADLAGRLRERREGPLRR